MLGVLLPRGTAKCHCCPEEKAGKRLTEAAVPCPVGLRLAFIAKCSDQMFVFVCRLALFACSVLVFKCLNGENLLL